MKKLLSFSFICFVLLLLSCNQNSQFDLSKIDPGRYDTTWYNHAPLRFIQTNLSEIDAKMNVDAYVKALTDVSASMVIFNVGGITANYPTKLPFHYTNPYLKGDLTGEVIRKFHDNGIKFIARFDISKINESLAYQKPEWLYVGTNGKTVNENGEVHTCLNGGYQQDYAFKILKEVIETYPLDAIFFNMGGYQTTDYSQVDYGICQCENCKKRFRDSTGLALPIVPDMNDPVYIKYREFQASTTSELNLRVKKFIKSLKPDLVFQAREGEIVRSESGTGFTSGRDWNYNATENVKRVLGTYKDQTPNDTYNYLIGMDYRHTATSPNIGKIFMAEQMLNGAGPGIYIMGRLENQYDRVFLPTLKELFGFHKTNQKLFTNVESLGKVGLIMGSSQDYRGIMKLLIEGHIMYDLIQASAVGSSETPRKLEYYDALILSNVVDMDDKFVSAIDNYVKNGGKILVTGFPGTGMIAGDVTRGASGRSARGGARGTLRIAGNAPSPSIAKIRLQSLGVAPQCELFPRTISTYLKVLENDKADLGKNEFKDFDLIMMNSGFLKCKTVGSAKSYMRLLPNTMHGPPEKCFFTDADVTDFPGMIANDFGKGKAVFIPWQIGSQYSWKGNNGQRAVFMAGLQNLLKLENSLVTDASPLIEMTHLANRNGVFEWVGMINHSGQIGDGFREPVPIYNTTIRFKPVKQVKEIRLIRSGTEIKFRENQGWVECVVPRLDDFEMVLCLYK
jgi:hypothetical protein